MKLIRIVLCSAALAVSLGSAAAQDTTVPATGETSAMQFLNVGASPRSWAMGGVQAGIQKNEYAQFGSVAAVPFWDETLAAGASYTLWQPTSANMLAAGAAWNISGRFGASFGVQTGLNPAYELTNSAGVPDGSFSPFDLRIGAGFAWRVIDCLSVGVGLNYASSRLAPASESYSGSMSSFAADVQLMYVTGNFDISLSTSNLGSSVKSASGKSFGLPMNARLAAGYGNGFGRHHLSAGLEGGMFFGGASAAFAGVGAEYMYNDFVAVRAGWHYGSEKAVIPTFASVGLGLCFAGVNIDVAYLIAAGDSPLQNSMSFGLGYSF